MTILDGLVQGIIQGLTEFLPVSSSGHLSLYQYFTGNSGEGSLFFSLMLHLGTLAAVLAAYYEDLLAMIVELGHMIGELFTGRFSPKNVNPNRKMIYMLVLGTLPLVLVLPLQPLVSRITGDGDIIVEGVCFLITSALLFVACKSRQGRAGIGKMRARHALTIGVVQGIASFPGISRSGSTVSAAMFLGFEREFAVKFSFLLGIPAILGGVVFEVGDAVEQGMEVAFWPLFIGMVTAAVVGYACIRLIRWLVLSDKFIIFAWYTLALGVVVVVLGIVGHLAGWGPQAAPSVARAANSAGAAALLF